MNLHLHVAIGGRVEGGMCAGAARARASVCVHACVRTRLLTSYVHHRMDKQKGGLRGRRQGNRNQRGIIRARSVAWRFLWWSTE